MPSTSRAIDWEKVRGSSAERTASRSSWEIRASVSRPDDWMSVGVGAPSWPGVRRIANWVSPVVDAGGEDRAGGILHRRVEILGAELLGRLIEEVLPREGRGRARALELGAPQVEEVRPDGERHVAADDEDRDGREDDRDRDRAHLQRGAPQGGEPREPGAPVEFAHRSRRRSPRDSPLRARS